MRRIFLIAYDLRSPGRNYVGLYDEIKAITGDWQHPMESVWCISSANDSSLSADNIQKKLKTQMDNNDFLFVVEITGQQHQGWLPTSFWDWMNRR